MTVWTAEVNNHCFSRVMGLDNFHTNDMKHAIRQVLHRLPRGFSRSAPVSQPLESEVCSKVVVNKHDNVAISSLHANVLTPCAVIDTGCQRSAIGRNTLNHIMKQMPPELAIKFQPKRFRFSGIGGETTTSEVALIPVCFGSRPGVVHAAVLEDTVEAPFLLSLPIMKELGAVLDISQHAMHFQALQETGKMFFNERGQLCLRVVDFDALAPECHQPNRSWKPRKIVGEECQVFTLQYDGRVPTVNVNGKDNVVSKIKNHDSIVLSNNGGYSEENQSNPSSSGSQSNFPFTVHGTEVKTQVKFSSLPASSTAETTTCFAASDRDCNSHVRNHGEPWQQAHVLGNPDRGDRACHQAV